MLKSTRRCEIRSHLLAALPDVFLPPCDLIPLTPLNLEKRLRIARRDPSANFDQDRNYDFRYGRDQANDLSGRNNETEEFQNCSRRGRSTYRAPVLGGLQNFGATTTLAQPIRPPHVSTSRHVPHVPEPNASVRKTAGTSLRFSDQTGMAVTNKKTEL
jgi:hypothetical protein